MSGPAQAVGPGDGSALPGGQTAARMRHGRMPRGLLARRPLSGVPAGRYGLAELRGTVSGELAAPGLAVTEFHCELVETDVANLVNRREVMTGE